LHGEERKQKALSCHKYFIFVNKKERIGIKRYICPSYETGESETPLTFQMMIGWEGDLEQPRGADISFLTRPLSKCPLVGGTILPLL